MTHSPTKPDIELKLSEVELCQLRTVLNQLCSGNNCRIGGVDGRRVGDEVRIGIKTNATKQDRVLP
jgi:hypothetical protein